VFTWRLPGRPFSNYDYAGQDPINNYDLGGTETLAISIYSGVGGGGGWGGTVIVGTAVGVGGVVWLEVCAAQGCNWVHAEHRTGARRSTRDKHQSGTARKQKLNEKKKRKDGWRQNPNKRS
jgi:hypothetical protein